MICGNCKGQHSHVSDVKACYGTRAGGSTRRPSESTTAAPVANVAAGRYAVEGTDGVLRFYRVDKPTEGKWAGYTFVKIYASDNTYPVKGAGRAAVLAEIAKDPRAAMLRYGREIGACGHCGRTLTNEDSRAKGIGPVCAQGMGWAA